MVTTTITSTTVGFETAAAIVPPLPVITVPAATMASITTTELYFNAVTGSVSLFNSQQIHQ